MEEESKEYIDKIEVVDEMSITLSIKKIPLRMKLRVKSKLRTIKALKLIENGGISFYSLPSRMF